MSSGDNNNYDNSNDNVENSQNSPPNCPKGKNCPLLWQRTKCPMRHYRNEIPCYKGRNCQVNNNNDDNSRCRYRHTCRWGFKCRLGDEKCKMYHPKPRVNCKNGSDCKNENCTFKH